MQPDATGPVHGRSSSHRGVLGGVAAALVVVAILGLVDSAQPFTGDQALFAAGARQLAHGDVLYRDVWDVKQPGIYWFYETGGALAGYGEAALHLFELAVQLAFGAFLAWTLRARFRHRAVVAAVPLLVVGTYYATAEPVQLTQVESLVGVPLFLALWCATRASARDAPRWWLVAAGFAGGLVLILKLVLAPVLAACWLPALVVNARRAGKARWRSILGDVGALGAGSALPLGVAAAYLGVHGQLGTVRWTYFEVTPATTGLAGRPVSRLVEGGLRTAARWAVPIVLAGVGLAWRRRRGFTRLDAGLVGWIVAAVPVFLVQHWWIYQYTLFLVPVGIFAADGIDAVATAWARWSARARIAIVATLTLLAVPLGLRIASNTHAVATHGFALTPENRRALHVDAEPNYRDALAWRRRLARVGATPNGVYVLGNPLDVYLSGRTSTVAINGWSPEQYPDTVWRRLRSQLIEASPDELVLDEFSATVLRDRTPRTRTLIAERYERVGRSGDEWWFRRRDAPSAG